jgi:O-antigen ligase
MQSQIWLLFGLFALLGMLYGFIKLKQKKYVSWIVVLIIVVISAISMSFSRSFWLAGIASLVVMLVILVFNKEKIKQVSSFGSIFVGLIVISIGLTVGVAMFPIPKGTMSADLLKDRAAKFSGEAAVSSRYSQIRPLLSSIKNHPIYGSGFGTSVTYASQDPRVLKNNPDGLYTTTAFELGWLEIWLKIGLLGVGFYLYLLWMIAKFGWRSNRENYLILGGIIGLVAVVLTHGVSPYLNHPLGIGVVMLMSGLVDKRN